MPLVHNFDTDPFTQSLQAFNVGRSAGLAERKARKRQESIERKQQNAQIAAAVGAVAGGVFLGPAIGAIGATAPTVATIGGTGGAIGAGLVGGSAGIGAAAGTLAGSTIGGALGGLVGGRGTGTPGGGAAIGASIGGGLAKLQAAETEGQRRTAATELVTQARLEAVRLTQEGQLTRQAQELFAKTHGITVQEALGDQNATMAKILTPGFVESLGNVSQPGFPGSGIQGPQAPSQGLLPNELAMQRIDQLSQDPSLEQFFGPKDQALRGRLRQAAGDVMNQPWSPEVKTRALNEITGRLQKVRPMSRRRGRTAKDSFEFTPQTGNITTDQHGRVHQLDTNLFGPEGRRISDNRRVGELYVEDGQRLRVKENGGTEVDISREDIATYQLSLLKENREFLKSQREAVIPGEQVDATQRRLAGLKRLTDEDALTKAERVMLGPDHVSQPIDTGVPKALPGIDDAIPLPIGKGNIIAEDQLLDGTRYVRPDGMSAIWDASIKDWAEGTTLRDPRAKPPPAPRFTGLTDPRRAQQALGQTSPRLRREQEEAARKLQQQTVAQRRAVVQTGEDDLVRIANERATKPDDTVTVINKEGRFIPLKLKALTEKEKKKLRAAGFRIPGID